MARVNRVALVVGALIAVPLVVFLALGFRHNPEVIESPLIGKPAPEFVLRDFAGGAIDLASLRGKPVVLNFWASWCQPCVAEHPLLVAAAQRYGGEVAFVGVVPSEDTAEAVERFTQRFGKWGPVVPRRRRPRVDRLWRVQAAGDLLRLERRHGS